MTESSPVNGRHELDGSAVLLSIVVERPSIVFLQALLEGYDGLAIVKTVDEMRGIVALITTRDNEQTCWDLLNSLSSEMPWRLWDGEIKTEELLEYRER